MHRQFALVWIDSASPYYHPLYEIAQWVPIMRKWARANGATIELGSCRWRPLPDPPWSPRMTEGRHAALAESVYALPMDV